MNNFVLCVCPNMARKTTVIRRGFARILAITFLILQGAILDYYLITEERSMWRFAWLTTDAIVFSTWVYTMWMSHRKSRSALAKDGMKIAYFAWIVYAVHLVPQVATLFKLKIEAYNDEKHVFGPNTLKMNLCLTPMLFLFLIYAHHDAKSHSRRKYYLEKITAAVALDLFDSVEMLEYLFDKEEISPELENAILAFSCMNIFLPTFALFELKYNKFHDNGEISPISFKFIYICSFMFFVNVPFFVLRLILWHGYHLNVSVLLAKNSLAIIMGLIEIFEFFGDQRPRRCQSCTKTFVKEFYKKHLDTCSFPPDQNSSFIVFEEERKGKEKEISKLDTIRVTEERDNLLNSSKSNEICLKTTSKETDV